MAKSKATAARAATQEQNEQNGATHAVARAALLEAAERVLGKEHSRDDVLPGSYPFTFTVAGVVGTRHFVESYDGTLAVGEDGVRTPSVNWQAVAASLLASMNEATQAARLADIAAGRFLEADEGLRGRIDAAARQYRESQKSDNPQPKRGDVRPVYRVCEAMPDLKIVK